MKEFVLVFAISLTIFYVNTFEYNEEYNTEDEERSSDYHRYILDQETLSSYGPILTPINTLSNDDVIQNYIPDEHVKPSEEIHAHEVATRAAKESKKPYYDEKDAPKLFRKFIKDFDKQYKDDEEYNKRYQNFLKILKDINQLNREQDATFDINMFADLSEGESVIG